MERPASYGRATVKGWWKIALPSFLIGALLCGAVVGYIAHGANAKLTADFERLGKSLAAATTDGERLAGTVRQLHGQLDNANSIVTRDSQELARRQRIIDGQQLHIDSLESGLADIASSITNAGGDLRKSISAIAEGFERLYRLYHPGSS